MMPTRVYQLLLSKPYPGAIMREARESCARVGCALEFPNVTITHWGSVWGDGKRLIDAALPDGHEGTPEQVHAEIRRVLAIVNADPSSTWAEIKADCVGPDLPSDDPLYDRATAEQTLARMTDAHAVVSQRLAGSQKEVAEVSAERDEAIARAAKIEDRLRRDDELRELIAVAVGLDGSASLALILDAVRRDAPDDPRAVKGLRALLDYTHAPIRFGERQLSDAERAAFVIRRLDARVSEVIAAEVFLDCAGVPAYALAPGDDPDAPNECLSLSERLRLHFAGQS